MIFARPSIAATYFFGTAGGSLDANGRAIDVTGFFTVTAGKLEVSITNLDPPETDVDAIYGIAFQVTQTPQLTISGPLTPFAVTAEQITISGDGTFTQTTAQVSDTAWNLTGSPDKGSSTATNLDFSIAGTGKPSDMVIGAATGADGNYVTGPGWPSIDRHPTYYWQTVTFDIAIPGLLSGAAITSNVDLRNVLALQFGTVPTYDFNVNLTGGDSGSKPEPDTLIFFGSGLLLVGVGAYRKKHKA